MKAGGGVVRGQGKEGAVDGDDGPVPFQLGQQYRRQGAGVRARAVSAGVGRARVSRALRVGGMDLLERYETRMAQEDPFSEDYSDMSLFAYGDGAFLKFDAEGRIMVSDFIRTHTGITDRVAFVGRNHFFQLWEPSRFEAYRAEARARLTARRTGRGMSEGAPE